MYVNVINILTSSPKLFVLYIRGNCSIGNRFLQKEKKRSLRRVYYRDRFLQVPTDNIHRIMHTFFQTASVNIISIAS